MNRYALSHICPLFNSERRKKKKMAESLTVIAITQSPEIINWDVLCKFYT